MKKEFEISMVGELSFFPALQISQSNKGIFISQSNYIKEMLNKFKMGDCKLANKPIIMSCTLRNDNKSLESNQTLYGSMIGSLLYLTTSRPDIMQVVGLVARFKSTPKETHVKLVKRIFKYIKGILDFGLWYPRSEEFTLPAYKYAGWVGSIDDKKSTSGGPLFWVNI